MTLLISTFVRNNFKLKESTLLLIDFFQTDKISECNVQVSKCNVQVSEDIRPRFGSLAK